MFVYLDLEGLASTQAAVIDIHHRGLASTHTQKAKKSTQQSEPLEPLAGLEPKMSDLTVIITNSGQLENLTFDGSEAVSSDSSFAPATSSAKQAGAQHVKNKMERFGFSCAYYKSFEIRRQSQVIALFTRGGIRLSANIADHKSACFIVCAEN